MGRAKSGAGLALLAMAAAAGAHMTPDMGLFEVKRTVTATSTVLVVEHEALLRPGVTETRATARLMDRNRDGKVAPGEVERFTTATAGHLHSDFVVMAARKGPGETPESAAAEPLSGSVVLKEWIKAPDGDVEGFRQRIETPLPEYLTAALRPGAADGAALELDVIDPSFMAMIDGLGSRAGESNWSPGTVLRVEDPSIVSDPAPGAVSHGVRLRLSLAKRGETTPTLSQQ